MKKLLTVPQGEHFAARIRSTMAALLIGLALGMTLWITTTPIAEAEIPTDQVALNFSQHLPPNTTAAKASKGQLVAAVTAAVKATPGGTGQFVRFAGQIRKGDIEDIVAAAIRALGRNPDCQLVAEAVEAGMDLEPKKAARLLEIAIGMTPNCTSQLQQLDRAGRGTETGTDQGEGNFGNAPGNQNPPPGSISGGGGSQSGRCQVCHTSGNGKRQTLTISCNAVPAHIGHGDTEGPCPVTPTQNP